MYPLPLRHFGPKGILERLKPMTPTGAELGVVGDPDAVRGADVVYPMLASMGQEDQAEEKERKFLQYQVKQLAQSGTSGRDGAALPAGQTGQGDDRRSHGRPAVGGIDESENRLHAHKAIMALTM